jgi:hypothetical protein
MKVKNQKNGFSVIEVILYVAIISIFLNGVVIFGWNAIQGEVKSSINRKMIHNLRYSGQKISDEIRNSQSINYIQPNDLCLSFSEVQRNPTRIYLNNNQIAISRGGGSTDCTNMTGEHFLTDNFFSVTNLNFNEISSPPDYEYINFKIEMLIDGARHEWQKSSLLEGGAEIRSK